MVISKVPTISTIVVLDTHPILRMGLALLLRENLSGMRIMEAKDIAEFQLTEELSKPDLFILVMNESEDDPMDEVKKRYPLAFQIVYGDEIQPDVTIDFFKSGLNGYLSKNRDLSELVACVETVMAGRRYLSPEYMDFLFGYMIQNYGAHRKQDILTPRQYEIAQYLIQGLTTSFIAEKTGLHISTISTFKAVIFSKMGVNNILKLREAIESDKNPRVF